MATLARSVCMLTSTRHQIRHKINKWSSVSWGTCFDRNDCVPQQVCPAPFQNKTHSFSTDTIYQPTRCIRSGTSWIGTVYLPNREIYINMAVVSRNAFSTSHHANGPLTDMMYEQIADKTLDILAEYFETLGDVEQVSEEYDVMFSSGVLTVIVGGNTGTYVINKQTPNKQIWLSSPSSGPKRYDYINGRWIYKHSGEALHDLLSLEFSAILNRNIDFSHLETKEIDDSHSDNN
ncbi:frataxin, mitochondrial-like [Saccoglossus kowalevskii]|uniref:ferroxidase n=1 Tax=Saccoglossus kowalevskii TaxID=10224 RepID=A0ABM0GLU0_SACKO|nr:PREDICTED: frataxin homolog, mitochondrial-like [Saccoglossus kowalevskii]